MNDTSYPTPDISIRVTYPATDGSMPEEVTVELNGDAVSGGLTMNVLQQLLEAPRSRPLLDRETDLTTASADMLEVRRGE